MSINESPGVGDPRSVAQRHSMSAEKGRGCGRQMRRRALRGVRNIRAREFATARRRESKVPDLPRGSL